ncbi:MAG: HemK2/MTQ2 family protein methyltransferase [Candidatus Methanofastidiosia archaeon]
MKSEPDINENENVYPVLEDSLLLADSITVKKGGKMLEVGCGTGFISLKAALAGAVVCGVDINADAVKLSIENAKRNNISNVRFFVSDIFKNVKGKYDVIIFNPPYLPSENFAKSGFDKCWNGGKDGRAVTQRFIRDVKDYLNSGGRVYLVQSTLGSGSRTIEELEQMGLVTKIIASKKLFFEEIFVVEARYL